MVSIKKRAYNDLDRMHQYLLKMKGAGLTRDFVIQYTQEIIDACYKIENLNFHHNATHSEHVKFGKKVYTYEHNFQTIWYIIYDFDQYGNIIIKKILNNHQMKSSN